MFLKKRHVLDAINRLERSQRKVPKLLIRTFYNLLDHAKRQGLNPTRLWVHGCLIGLTKRYRSTRYAAKGRGYKEKRDFCQVKVILWEKPENEFYEEIAVGEAAPAISNLVRFILKKQDASHKELARFTGVTTARGKQQARLIFKRKVDQVMLANQQSGTYEPRKVIAARLKAELGEAMKEKLASLQQEEHSSLRLRERLYKKNMGL